MAIESILGQSYDAIEVVIIENGSTDGTLTVAERYRGDRVTLLSRRDGHLVAALNDGFAVSRARTSRVKTRTTGAPRTVSLSRWR